MRRNIQLLYPDGEGGGGERVTNDHSPDSRIEAAEALASAAITRYRELVASGPGLVSGMVHGDTVEQIDASVEAARQAYTELSRRIAERYEREVPTGNPARSTHTIAAETLKPEAKIALGLRRADR